MQYIRLPIFVLILMGFGCGLYAQNDGKGELKRPYTTLAYANLESEHQKDLEALAKVEVAISALSKLEKNRDRIPALRKSEAELMQKVRKNEARLSELAQKAPEIPSSDERLAIITALNVLIKNQNKKIGAANHKISVLTKSNLVDKSDRVAFQQNAKLRAMKKLAEYQDALGNGAAARETKKELEELQKILTPKEVAQKDEDVAKWPEVLWISEQDQSKNAEFFKESYTPISLHACVGGGFRESDKILMKRGKSIFRGFVYECLDNSLKIVCLQKTDIAKGSFVSLKFYDTGFDEAARKLYDLLVELKDKSGEYHKALVARADWLYNKYGMSLLKQATAEPENLPFISALAKYGNVNGVEFLLSKNKELVNQVDRSGNNALYRALENMKYDPDYVTIVNMLLEAGADVNKGNSLARAIISGCEYGIIKKLIDKGADTNKSMNYFKNLIIASSAREGVTPLMIAVVHRREDVVRLLLENGADKNAKDSEGETAANYVFGNQQIMDILNQAQSKKKQKKGIHFKEGGAEVREIEPEGKGHKTPRIKGHDAPPRPRQWSKEKSPDLPETIEADLIAAQEKARRNAIIARLTHNHPSVLSAEEKAALNEELREALDNALIPFKGYKIEYIVELIRAGADVNIKSEYDNYALMLVILSAKNDDEALSNVKLCLSKGANPNDAASYNLKTPLMLAADKGFEKSVKALLDAGADKNLKDSQGKTAYDYAKTDAMKKLLNPS